MSTNPNFSNQSNLATHVATKDCNGTTKYNIRFLLNQSLAYVEVMPYASGVSLDNNAAVLTAGITIGTLPSAFRPASDKIIHSVFSTVGAPATIVHVPILIAATTGVVTLGVGALVPAVDDSVTVWNTKVGFHIRD